MFNPAIVLVIIIQAVVARYSRMAGAVIGYLITTGILVWGISVYGNGNYIALFGIQLSESFFLIACLVWYAFDTKELMDARKAAAAKNQVTGSATLAYTAQLPAFLILFLWLIIGILVTFSWSPIYTFINPNFADNLMTVADIATYSLSGLMIGFFQWLLLIYIIPNANRWFLALWIPASIFGWAIGSVIRGLVTVPDTLLILVSAFSGLTVGILQWFILRKYSNAAIWWIPACVVDWAAASLFGNLDIWKSNIDFSLLMLLGGVIGTIASSIAIVFIVKKALSVTKPETGSFSEAGGL